MFPKGRKQEKKSQICAETSAVFRTNATVRTFGLDLFRAFPRENVHKGAYSSPSVFVQSSKLSTRQTESGNSS